jgi:hypothetical protein
VDKVLVTGGAGYVDIVDSLFEASQLIVESDVQIEVESRGE